MALNLRHQTAAQFAARLREKYRTATSYECAVIANWILNKISSGDFTDLQVRNAFGLTAIQYTTLKNKLIALQNNYIAVLNSAGE